MLAAFHVFLDYPLLGVGPGHYSPYYSVEYMSNPEIAFRNITTTRRAHSLYFELAAETGVIGLAFFLGMVFHVLRALWGLRRRLMQTRSDLANLATGFFLGLLMYYTTALFLHLSFQRYYWLFFGVAAAAIQLLRQAEREAVADADARSGARSTLSALSPPRLSTGVASQAVRVGTAGG
jgi:O-antigen ligase